MESLKQSVELHAETLNYFNFHAKSLYQKRLADSRSLDLTAFTRHLPSTAAIFDWGCGPGIDLARFAWLGHSVQGIDSAEQMIAIAKQSCPGANLFNKNGLLHSIAANTLDGFWANESLNSISIEQAQRVIGMAFQSLRAGGILGVVVKEGSGVYEDRSIDLEGPSQKVYFYPERALCSLIEQTGFVIVEVGKNPEAGLMMVIAKRI
jgi:SAM-dependent methyltransferase